MLEIIGIIVMIQGVLGFAGPAFLGKDLGLLHLWFDLPPLAYLGIAAVGGVVLLLGSRGRSKSRTT